jgi:hypothetical protein
LSCTFIFQANEEQATAPAALLGEQRLLWAIIERAIRDCLKRQRHISRDAEQWFDNIESREPFSFGWICEHLGLEPAVFGPELREAARKISTGARGLETWKKREGQRIRRPVFP